MDRRQAKARQSIKKDEGSSNPPNSSNVQRPQCHVGSHCGQIINARRVKFKDSVQRDSSELHVSDEHGAQLVLI